MEIKLVKGDRYCTGQSKLPPGLRELYCGYCDLTELPELPDSLVKLYCYGNNLSTLPDLPKNLFLLDCSNCKIDKLPELPASLRFLRCYSNMLTTLPDLPIGLKYLECSSCYLTNLPKLPNSLAELYCNYNKLSRLPELPPSLTKLVCGDNALSGLPVLHDSLEKLVFDFDAHHANVTAPPHKPCPQRYILKSPFFRPNMKEKSVNDININTIEALTIYMPDHVAELITKGFFERKTCARAVQALSRVRNAAVRWHHITELADLTADDSCPELRSLHAL